MMRIDIMTLFPEMCETVLGTSIIGRARDKGCIEINCVQIRDFSTDKHRRVDDAPYGGGTGMVMKTEPIYNCYTHIVNEIGRVPHLIYMSPQGRPLTQDIVKELSKIDNICILCGHYEGVDERLIEEIVDEEISIGDYVLTGGELPALVLSDAISRMLPGVLSNDDAFTVESHFDGLLEHPQYTRPPIWKYREVPGILLSGHHANIIRWQRNQALIRTKNKRPDMFERIELDKYDKKFLKELENGDNANEEK